MSNLLAFTMATMATDRLTLRVKVLARPKKAKTAKV